MIAFLKGTLAGKTATTAYIEVNGVGYAVGMSQALSLIHIKMCIRDRAWPSTGYART